jgi:hypothetical protein
MGRVKVGSMEWDAKDSRNAVGNEEIPDGSEGVGAGFVVARCLIVRGHASYRRSMVYAVKSISNTAAQKLAWRCVNGATRKGVAHRLVTHAVCPNTVVGIAEGRDARAALGSAAAAECVDVAVGCV